MNSAQDNETTRPDAAGRLYGEVVYWSTIAAALVVIICTTLALLCMDNALAPAWMFDAVLAGQPPAEIWGRASVAMPDGGWYLRGLGYGDALVMLGMVSGIFSVVPACFISAGLFFYRRQRFFGVMGAVTGLLILLPCLGVI